MKIQKVSSTKKGILIKYIDDKNNEITLESNEEPAHSFINALLELRQYMNVIAELNDAETDIDIKSVNFSENDKGECVIFSYMRRLTNGQMMLINTPVRSEESLSDDLVMAAEEVRKQTRLFINGSRKLEQKLLFDKESGIGFSTEYDDLPIDPAAKKAMDLMGEMADDGDSGIGIPSFEEAKSQFANFVTEKIFNQAKQSPDSFVGEGD